MDKLKKQSYSIKGVVDRFEGKQAIIKTDNGQRLKWPIKNLPESIKEGSSVRISLATSKTDEEERKKIAKSLLNELLKNNT